MTGIHPTALVDPQAQLDSSVSVGPYTVIGPHVKVALLLVNASQQLTGDALGAVGLVRGRGRWRGGIDWPDRAGQAQGGASEEGEQFTAREHRG